MLDILGMQKSHTADCSTGARTNQVSAGNGRAATSTKGCFTTNSDAMNNCGTEITRRNTGRVLVYGMMLLAFWIGGNSKAMGQTVVASGSCGTNLSYVLMSDSTFTIYGYGAMTDYSVVFPNPYPNSPWYSSNRNRIKTVIIGDSVISIGGYAFYQCSNLISVTIGNSVTSVLQQAFSQCSGLTSITIYCTTPPTVGYSAFYGVATNIPIYVPCDSLLAYKQATQWSGFTHYYCINPAFTFNTVTTCSFPYNDANFTNLIAAGTYYDTLQSVGGSDSIIALMLIDGTSFSPYSATICYGASYTDANFTNLTQAGMYYDTLQNVNSCDSIVCLTLYYFNMSGTCGSNLTWDLNRCDSTLTISGSGAMDDFINAPWTFYRSGIKKIIIDSGVTKIGDNAFISCINLDTIICKAIIPPTIRSTGTFSYVPITVKIYVPCSSISTYQGTWIWSSFTNYQTFLPGSGMCGIALTWKLSCDSTTLIIGGSGTMTDFVANAMPWYAYQNTIKTLVIGDSVTSIGNNAFNGLSGLISITCDATTPPTAGANAFNGVSAGIPIDVPCIAKSAYQNSAEWNSFTNYMGNIDGGTFGNLTWKLSCDSTTLTIGGIGSISSAPWNIYQNVITSVVIGDSITAITVVRAFENYSNLISVTIGNGITSIPNAAFQGCRNLTSVKFGDSVKSIGQYTFNGCSNLDSIIIPHSVTYIGMSAFNGCSNLTAITISDSVTYIDNWTFSGCSSLTYLTIGNGVTDIGSYAFGSCISLDSVTIPNSVKNISSGAFSGCSNLTSVILGDSVTNIGGMAFNGCGLISIALPNSVTTLGNDVFWNCNSLTSIDVDSNNMNYSSENGVLFNKAKTTLVKYPPSKAGASYNVPNSVTSIGQSAFMECRNLISIDLLNSLNITVIKDYTFMNCINLTSVTISDSVTYIGYGVFANCQSLNSVTIPNKVTYIEGYAFAYCYSLNSITSDAINPPELETSVFVDVPDLIPIYVPCGTTATYQATTGWNYFSNFIGFMNDTTFFYDTICPNTIYNGNGFNISDGADIYYRIERTTQNCDSIICLYLAEYLPIPITTYSASIVEGETYNDANFTDLTQAGLYCDTLENVNGCDSVVCLTLTVTGVGIVETDNYPSLRVYPNPANNQLTITCKDAACHVPTVAIYNVVGQMVGVYGLRPENTETTIDISNLAKGMYYLRIGEKTARFVKE